jgi:hypothetical protein
LLNLTELGVEVLIKKNKHKNINAFWDNYSLVVWQKDSSGFTSSKGMFKDSWGVAEKFSVNNDGIWKVPLKYVKFFK